MADPRIPRRTFLRGVGTLMALPMLEAMMPLSVLAQSVKKAPRRMAFCFVPNGINMHDWTPTTEGAFDLPYILQPMANVKDKLTVFTGLTQQNAFALGDGGGDHARSAACWLTGCHPKKTDGADIKNGISVDQLAAMHIGRETRLPSIEIGCEGGAQSGNCDSGYSCAYSSSVSWRGEALPMAHEINPRSVFERLFGNGDPTETAESRARRERLNSSILDVVMDDANRLKTQLGSHDQSKLDEYFTGVRELEQRLDRVDKISSGAEPNYQKPSGIPAEYADHVALMYDMMALAFQSDTTRIVTFMLANDGSNRNYKNIGIPEGHHDCSHHGGDPVKLGKVREINRFHITEFARFTEKLNSMKEGDGTVLDNSMIMFGAGISDGDRHNHDNLPIIMAGRGGGTIKTNRHQIYPDGTKLTNLFLSMLDRVGVPADHIGDSSGRLDGLI